MDWKAAKKRQSNQVPISCLPIRTPVRHWYASLYWIIIAEEKQCDLRNGPLENLLGGGGKGGRSTKKYWHKRKLNEKKYACQLTQKIFMLRSKTNSYREFDNEKHSCGSKIPPPPDKFSNGLSLIDVISFSSQ